jgi:tetratricopeptide (TPR) repeat protein
MTGSVIADKFGKDQLIKGVGILVAMLAFAVLWFFLVHSVRIKELRYRLKTSTDQSGSVRTMSLVSRFRVLRQVGLTDESQGYAREGRLMQILADTAHLDDAEELGRIEYSAKLTIDFFDFIAGTPPFKYDKNSRSHRILERGFYHEITRSYKEAIAAYDTALTGTAKGSDLRSYGLLHRGFCRALASDRANAATDFREVIATSSDSEYVETARILLAMISEIDVEIKRVDSMPLSVEKANAYYSLTAYDRAIATYKEMGATSPNGSFYLARSLEETGKATAAVAEYRKAIASNPGSVWAVKANRRLFALGSFYAAGKEYRKESTSNVERGVVQDKELLVEAKRFEKVSERIEEGEKKIVAAYLAKPEVLEAPPAAVPQAAVTPPVVAPPVTPPAVNPTAQVTPPAAVQPPEVVPPQATAVIPTPPAPQAPVPTPAEIEKAKAVTGPDWAKLEKLPRAEKIAYINRHKKVESVMLENGNQFSGLRISENKDRLILFTALGRVVILKSDIETRETASP